MRALHSVPFLLSAALVLSACGGGPPDPDPGAEAVPGAAAEADSEAAGAGYPLSLDNCGTNVDLEEPPQRILTVKSTATELVLSLGLGDRLVGSAFSDGPLPDHLASTGAAVPEVSDGVPSQEAVLDLGPDFIFAGWESVFSADGAGERASLAEFGVDTYVAPAACQGAGYKPEQLDFNTLFDDIREAGAIFDAEQAADDLVVQQQDILDEVRPVEGEPTALWYSSGTDTPYVGAGSGAPQMMMEQAGFENIGADIDDSWTSMSWEAIAERDPEVIILVDADWNTADDKIARLESSPVTSQLSAVRSGSYLRVPFAASEAGVRNAEAVADLSQQYGELSR